MNKRGILILLIAVCVCIGLIYLYADREIVDLKRGSQQPILWNREQFEEKPIKLTTKNQSFSGPNVSITPIYYMPDSHELQMGLWFKKWHYQDEGIPDRVFEVSYVDETGKVYNQETVVRVSGVYENFHYRKVSGIDLEKVKSLELVITLVKQEGEQVVPIESKRVKVPLDQIKDKVKEKE